MDQYKGFFLKNSKWLTPVILALIALVFAIFFSRFFRWPVGVGYDSVVYINGAKSLAAGNGFTQNSIPITHYPPLYPASLAVVAWITGKDIIASATMTVIFLYGLNIFLAGLLVFRISNSLLAGSGMTVVLAILPGFVAMHFEAMSEPLFFGLLFLALILLMEYLRSGWLTWAVLAGFAAGLSALTRYIGVFIIAAAVAAIFFLFQGSYKRRLSHTIIGGIAACLPITAWLIRNQLVTGGLTNRMFVYHPQNLDYFLYADNGFSDLLGLNYFTDRLPGKPGLFIIFASIIVLALGVYFLARHQNTIKKATAGRLFLIVCIFSIIGYVSFLLFSVTFFDASTRLTARILSPLYVLLVLGLWIIVWQILHISSNPKIHLLFAVVIIALVFIYLPDYREQTSVFRQKGDKFTGKAWSNSATISWLKKIPDSIIVYSNEAVPIGFLTDHPTSTIPEMTNSLTGLPSDTFKDRTATMESDLHQGKAVLLIMSTKAYSDIFQPKAILIKDLRICKKIDDGIVYSAPNYFQNYCDQ